MLYKMLLSASAITHGNFKTSERGAEIPEK